MDLAAVTNLLPAKHTISTKTHTCFFPAFLEQQVSDRNNMGGEKGRIMYNISKDEIIWWPRCNYCHWTVLPSYLSVVFGSDSFMYLPLPPHTFSLFDHKLTEFPASVYLFCFLLSGFCLVTFFGSLFHYLF